MTPRPVNFPQHVRFRAEPGFAEAVHRAARHNRTSVGEYLRRAVRAKVQADGIDLPPIDDITGRKAA